MLTGTLGFDNHRIQTGKEETVFQTLRELYVSVGPNNGDSIVT